MSYDSPVYFHEGTIERLISGYYREALGRIFIGAHLRGGFWTNYCEERAPRARWYKTFALIHVRLRDAKNPPSKKARRS